MAKTNWANGDFLTPAFMNTVWGTTASTGHKHTGLNNDGSLPKVDINNANEVSGRLPTINNAPLPGYINNLNVIATGSLTAIQPTSGSCTDSTNTSMISYVSDGRYKRIDQAWAAGNAQGGCVFGSTVVTDTYYNVYIVWKDNGDIDFAIDDNSSGSNVLSQTGFTYMRRIGSFLTETSGTALRVAPSSVKPLGTAVAVDLYDPVSDTVALSDTSGGYLNTGVIGPNIHNSLMIVGCSAPEISGAYILLLDPYGTSGSTASDEFYDAFYSSHTLQKKGCTGKIVHSPLSYGSGLGRIVFTTYPTLFVTAGNITGYLYGWIDYRDS